MSRGNAPEAKNARRRRLIESAKARGRQLEIALDRARVRAAQAIAPHDEETITAERERSRYVVKTYVHRQTGSRIRILDTEAEDGPRERLLPATDGHGEIMRYAVECLDHDSEPQYYATLKDATKGVRNSAKWCKGCRQTNVPEMRPKVNARNKQLAQHRL
ncbi:hypothetical protein J4573_50425 [Actinomadura barringtoniae]|uniref:Uncharacterized protein n=1 Tax=Actinomadura barringtoniae TaxID=1427535 RepID=A0A939PN33_9ACTN|nr:hypothetical protein [Actinomadura barringtoniae]MBO2455372.1 hypothetical protein [Actinomadura barringtoniae]